MTAPRQLSRSELAAMVDHTLLEPEATPDEVSQLCDEARRLAVHAVCISPSLVAHAVAALAGDPTVVVAVVGFPSGAHHTQTKQTEATLAVADGASELDMVMNLGLARAGRWSDVEREIAAVRATAGPDTLLKVIIEAALLDRQEIVSSCRAAEAAGARYVKSSTGFHPAGGASEPAVRLMAETVGARLGVKAAGGIGTAEEALSMVAAGATRLGMSHTTTVLEQLPDTP